MKTVSLLDKYCFYFGTKTPVTILIKPSVKKPNVYFANGVIAIETHTNDDLIIQNAFFSFCKKSLKGYIEKRLSFYQPHFKIKPKAFKIEASIKNWGTCNHLRELTFNIGLITLSRDLIDYVVVHEMCHMVHLNHDRSFWRLLGKIYPNYKECESKLSQPNT